MERTSQRTSLGYNSIMDRIEQLNETVVYDFKYSSGEIIQALFEGNTARRSFRERMTSDPSGNDLTEATELQGNQLIKELYKEHL